MHTTLPQDCSTHRLGTQSPLPACDVAYAGVRHVDLVLHLMAQPPWDARMILSANKPFYILHYTYGNDFTLDGKYTPGAGIYWHGPCPPDMR